MRDLIWTLILVWLVWKLIEMFKNTDKSKQHNNSHTVNVNNTKQSQFNSSNIEDVDYEEIK